MTPSYQHLIVAIRDHIMEIRLNRPHLLNALNDSMLKELALVLEQARSDDNIHVVILSGSGRGFCSGQDLKELAARGGEVNIQEHLTRYYDPVIMALYHMPKPTIAKIQGIAAGAGMSLALACDIRLGSENAQFAQSFVKIGLVPDSGSTYFLPRLIGMAKAMELALLGDIITGERAYSMGLLNQLVPNMQLDTVTWAWAERLRQLPSVTLGLIKEGIHKSLDHSLSEQLQVEQQLQALAAATKAHHMAVQSFLEKKRF
ncbi:enoyl-CoA hydratase/isomerase family protein [Sulfobacillus thermosulfidooxidans]|uniref:enoyl-CoA hydratase/isomerase family protein n=1 Tax=Sulfobacillus thermosulfidooxidans TaxID=28034 RepID=UPI00031756CB|nr:enoyl-CoA hydratase-related protein [Sulfobacillus thermosulfidooxidans]